MKNKKDTIKLWFDSLISQIHTIRNFKTITNDTPLQGEEKEDYLMWKLSCRSLLKQLFGEDSIYYKEFTNYKELPKTHILGKTEFKKFHLLAVEFYERILRCARDEWERFHLPALKHSYLVDTLIEILDNSDQSQVTTQVAKIFIRRIASMFEINKDEKEALEDLVKQNKISIVAKDKLKLILEGKLNNNDKQWLKDFIINY